MCTVFVKHPPKQTYVQHTRIKGLFADAIVKPGSQELQKYPQSWLSAPLFLAWSVSRKALTLGWQRIVNHFTLATASSFEFRQSEGRGLSLGFQFLLIDLFIFCFSSDVHDLDRL